MAIENSRPTGTNCTLSSPPSTAGEAMNHGATLRIHPRAKDIGGGYSGCQIMWMQDGEQWLEVAVVAIDSGDPVRIWSPIESDSPRAGCIYKKGKVVQGDAGHCIAPQFLIIQSFASGCVKKIAEAVAAGGASTPVPEGCEYE